MLFIDYRYTNAEGAYAHIGDVDEIDACICWLKKIRDEMKAAGKKTATRLDHGKQLERQLKDR